MNKQTKIYIAGHKGMVGSAIWRELESKGYDNLLGKSSKQLDLKNQSAVQKYFEEQKPEVVINAAARVGGILANNEYPYNFLMENLQIQNNLIQMSVHYDVQQFVFLGSSCIYPKFAPQPLKETYLLTDTLEPTNQWYAIAKIAGVMACESVRKQYSKNFVSLMPTNLYGPHDNFDLKTSHVLPAMIRKFYDAKQDNNATVTLWGTGTPMREFLYVDDLAKAVTFTLENRLKDNLYNVGTGKDISINQLAMTIQKIVGHQGKIKWDNTRPDGTPRKLMDVTKLQKQGWSYQTELEEGIVKTYQWFIQHQSNYKTLTIQ